MLLNRRPDATERLLEYAESVKGSGSEQTTEDLTWRQQDVEQRLAHALIKGIDKYIEEDVEEVRQQTDRCLTIIEGPLDGWHEAGRRPVRRRQDVSAPGGQDGARDEEGGRLLLPFMEAEKEQPEARQAASRGKIVMATVKGDVHDIGKNIVGVVLGCNNYEVIDLGVMVPCEKDPADGRRTGADMIGLSGLDHAQPGRNGARRCRRWSVLELNVPLLIGGATTSARHTAVRIAPCYSGPNDPCQRCVTLPRRGRSVDERRTAAITWHENRDKQQQLVESFEKHQLKLVPYEEARRRRLQVDVGRGPNRDARRFSATECSTTSRCRELVDYIDWSPFFMAWELKGKYPRILDDPKIGAAARELYETCPVAASTRSSQASCCRPRPCTVSGPPRPWTTTLSFSPTGSIAQELATFHTLRQQWEKKGQDEFRALADYVAPRDSGLQDYLGGFVLTAGIGAERAGGPIRSRPRRLQCHHGQGSGGSFGRGICRAAAPAGAHASGVTDETRTCRATN